MGLGRRNLVWLGLVGLVIACFGLRFKLGFYGSTYHVVVFGWLHGLAWLARLTSSTELCRLGWLGLIGRGMAWLAWLGRLTWLTELCRLCWRGPIGPSLVWLALVARLT